MNEFAHRPSLPQYSSREIGGLVRSETISLRDIELLPDERLEVTWCHGDGGENKVGHKWKLRVIVQKPAPAGFDFSTIPTPVNISDWIETEKTSAPSRAIVKGSKRVDVIDSDSHGPCSDCSG